MRKQTNITIIVAIIIFLLLQVSLLSAEPMRLQSSNTRFPIVIAFPIVPKTGLISTAADPNSMSYYFSAQDEDASFAYTVLITRIGKKIGVITQDTARMMINKALDTQITSTDTVLGVTGKVIKTNTEPLTGYPSKYIEVVRQTTPNLFGSYRAFFVDRILVTVWASGLDTVDNRSQAITFIKSLKIDQEME